MIGKSSLVSTPLDERSLRPVVLVGSKPRGDIHSAAWLQRAYVGGVFEVPGAGVARHHPQGGGEATNLSLLVIFGFWCVCVVLCWVMTKMQRREGEKGRGESLWFRLLRAMTASDFRTRVRMKVGRRGYAER